MRVELAAARESQLTEDVQGESLADAFGEAPRIEPMADDAAIEAENILRQQIDDQTRQLGAMGAELDALEKENSRLNRELQDTTERCASAHGKCPLLPSSTGVRS